MTQASLTDILDEAPLIVCLGPGGVGKTTVSAVLALHAAATSRRSLVLTIDPARRLADALSLPGLTNDPTEITAFRKMHPQGSYFALMLDPAATFDHMISMLVADPARREALLSNRFFQNLSRTLAGTLEYMAVERLHNLLRCGDFDSIVLDTPPTSNALDFLDAPDRLSSFFSDRVIRWFKAPEASSKRWTSRLLDRAGSQVLGMVGLVAGNEFAQDMSGFFTAFGDLLGDFRLRGERIGSKLRDPRTVFVVVTSPDPYRLAEAQEIYRRVREAGCSPRAFIVNRVDQAFVPDWVNVQSTIERATELLGGSAERERVQLFVERLEALRHKRDDAAGYHARAVAQLRDMAEGCPVFTAPTVPGGQSPRASLLAIYLGLFAGAAVGAS